MLKINPKKDIKELEKFGFENTIKNTWVKATNNAGEHYETAILVNPRVNSLPETTNRVVHYVNNDTGLPAMEEDGIDLISDLDVLYDLIKADMVVKE